MNILITGAYGFIGTNLANYLKPNYILWALDIKEILPGLYNRFFSWDAYEDIPFNDVDLIIHLAGKAHDTKNQSKAEEYFQINTDLTKKVFNSFLSSEARKFIFFSSVKAAADSVNDNSLTEEVFPKPKGPYGESKIAAEKYIQEYFNFESKSSKFVYIFRPSMIHGPGNKGNLNLLYNVVRKGIPWPLGAYDNKRSFTSVDNLCYIVEQTIKKDIDSGIYHVADDDPLSTNVLISIICKVLHKKVRIWKIPKSIINWGAKCGDIFHLPLNTSRLNKLTENYMVSNQKIKKAIQIDQLPTDAQDGLIKTISSFQENSSK